MRELVGLRAYSRHRGVSLSAVQKAIATGRLDAAVQTLPSGEVKLNVEVADAEWEENTDPSQRRSDEPASARADHPSLFPDANEPPPGTRTGADLDARSMQQAKRLQVLAKAKLLMLELDERRGRLVDRTTVESRAIEAAAITRQAILAVPAQVRDDLAATKDPHRVQQLLEQALERALSAVATSYRARGRAPKAKSA